MRRKLAAGNWKMNGTAASLSEVDGPRRRPPDAVRRHRPLPARHAPLPHGGARRPPSASADRTATPPPRAPTPATSRSRCSPTRAPPTSSSATPNAAPTMARPTPPSAPRPRRLAGGLTAIVCIGETAGGARRGPHARRRRHPARRLRPRQRHRRRPPSSPTNPSGPSAPARSPTTGRDRRGPRLHPRRPRERFGAEGAASASSTAARSRPRTRPRSSPCPTSTARSSVAPRSRPPTSRPSWPPSRARVAELSAGPLPRPRAAAGARALRATAYTFAALCLLPMVAVAIAALTGGTDTVAHLAETVLPGYAATTLTLVALVATGTTLIGVGAAWLVTMTRFPGVRLFEIALALPLAFPAYVLAYAYTHFLDHPGAVQTLLRDVTGWGPRDYWFPEIRSLPGAALMLIFVLYPYVYLLARAAFLQQSATAFLAARALGADRLGRVLAGKPPHGPPRHRRRRAPGDHGDDRRLRHRRPFRRPDLRDRHLHKLVLARRPRGRGAACPLPPRLRAPPRHPRTHPARRGPPPRGGRAASSGCRPRRSRAGARPAPSRSAACP